MTDPFGGPVTFHSGDAEDGTSSLSAHEDMDLVRRTLLGLGDGEPGFLRVYRPPPAAAFSPRDRTSKHYAAAAEAMRCLGFEPVERLAGGQLAVYDRNALVIDLIVPHSEPRAHVLERYKRFAATIVSALASLGVTSHIGALEGEYCPGDYSVNAAGRIKLAGVAQRIGKQGYHLGAVISVARSEQARDAVATAYQMLGIPFEPKTFGAISDLAPSLTFTVVRSAILNALANLVNADEVSPIDGLAGVARNLANGKSSVTGRRFGEF